MAADARRCSVSTHLIDTGSSPAKKATFTPIPVEHHANADDDALPQAHANLKIGSENSHTTTQKSVRSVANGTHRLKNSAAMTKPRHVCEPLGFRQSDQWNRNRPPEHDSG
jgi:hypothetical protein